MHPAHEDQTVAIVGGGALGATLFAALVDRLASAPSSRPRIRLVLFEKADRIGPGLAYARDASPYLLNQSAQTMSLDTSHDMRFCEWLEEKGDARASASELLCTRQLFGDYVEECFARAFERARSRGLTVSTVRDEVSSLVPRRAGGYRVMTSAGPPVDADIVVLAVGHLGSSRFRALEGPGFLSSPYPSAAMLARIPREARVGILGTGLSAIDAALALSGAGHTGPVTMTSRSGLLPAVRGPLLPRALGHVTVANLARATDHGRTPLRWSTLLTWVERELAEYGLDASWELNFPAWSDPLAYCASQVAAAERGERVWQSLGESLNPMIELLWRALGESERRLFLERYRSRFMSHWVSIPLVTGRRLLALLSERRVTALPGFRRVTPEGTGGYRLDVRGHRGAYVDFVIDATGTPRHLSECSSPLVHALLQQGTVTAHEDGGVCVDFESLNVLRADRRPDPSLLAVGHLTCGTHLFTSTLEMNARKAEGVAQAIVAELSRRQEKDLHVHAAPHTP